MFKFKSKAEKKAFRMGIGVGASGRKKKKKKWVSVKPVRVKKADSVARAMSQAEFEVANAYVSRMHHKYGLSDSEAEKKFGETLSKMSRDKAFRDSLMCDYWNTIE